MKLNYGIKTSRCYDLITKPPAFMTLEPCTSEYDTTIIAPMSNIHARRAAI